MVWYGNVCMYVKANTVTIARNLINTFVIQTIPSSYKIGNSFEIMAVERCSSARLGFRDAKLCYKAF